MTPPRPEPPFVLALDIGSTAVRARIYDSRVEPVPGAQRELRRIPAADGVEDPAALAEAAEAAIDGALHDAGPEQAASIAGVAMATFAGNLLGLSADGSVATPLYTYAHAGGGDEVRELGTALDADAVYQRTGAPFHTSYQAPTLLWLRKRDPNAFEQVVRWVDLGTCLYTRWFDRTDVPASYSIASWSGMLDRFELEWDRELTNHLELATGALPPLADYDEPLSGLAPAFAARWPALASVPFFLAVGDGAGANVGTGCGASGTVALTVGTTGAMRAVFDGTPTAVPHGLWAYRVDRDHSLLGGAITDGGSLLSWLHRTLRLRGEHLLDEEISAVEPDGHGLTVLPFLRGERSPGWATEAAATWHGIRASTTPADMARAGLEALSYRFCLIGRLLDEAGQSFDRVVAGGATITSLPAWMQMLADVLQKPVVPSSSRGTTARGITIMALKALGEIDSYSAFPASIGDPYLPDPAAARRYQQGLDRHTRLYHKLIG